MKKNILNLYEGFFDDLDKLNQDDEFGDVNGHIYDEHDVILSPDKNPEFFETLNNYYDFYHLSHHQNYFTKNDFLKITELNVFRNKFGLWHSYFQKIKSANELKYFFNLKKINDLVFENCHELKSIELPINLEYIGWHCFSSCNNLNSIILPNNLKKIDTGSFSACVKLKNINIPPLIEEIPSNCFWLCKELKNIQFSKNSNLKNLGISAFQECYSLEEIIIPDGVKIIHALCFLTCINLKKIFIPNSVEKIGRNAFEGISKEISITLPEKFKNQLEFIGLNNYIQKIDVNFI